MLWHGLLVMIVIKCTKRHYFSTNSWGKWNSGPKRLGQPDGSFWIRERDARGMLSGRGSWVFSDVDGFPSRELPDYGTGDYL